MTDNDAYREMQARCYEAYGDAPVVCTPAPIDPDEPETQWLIDHGYVRSHHG